MLLYFYTRDVGYAGVNMNAREHVDYGLKAHAKWVNLAHTCMPIKNKFGVKCMASFARLGTSSRSMAKTCVAEHTMSVLCKSVPTGETTFAQTRTGANTSTGKRLGRPRTMVH